jgi:serine/threonine protein kinase
MSRNRARSSTADFLWQNALFPDPGALAQTVSERRDRPPRRPDSILAAGSDRPDDLAPVIMNLIDDADDRQDDRQLEHLDLDSLRHAHPSPPPSHSPDIAATTVEVAEDAPTVLEAQTIPIAPGSVIGHYRVLEPLAHGGMGMVFAGEDLHLGRRVALKFLHERLVGDGSAVPRFFAEAVAAARISHHGVVSVFDYGSFESGAYLVMEFLGGETLNARLKREQRLPIARVLDIGVQLGLTLAATHDAGVIHRDLKPDNVHLVPDPAGSGYEFIKVLDFGVAKLTAGATPPLTQRGDLLGTPFYMAPEQSVDPGNVDHRCDIYSLGCLLYQLVTGRVPFRGSMLEILLAHQNAVPEPPRSFDPAIPPALEALILRMMAKSRQERPASMVDVVAALGAIQREEQTRAASAQPLPPLRGLALVVFLISLGLMLLGIRHLVSGW